MRGLNPRQRQGVLLVVIAALGLIGVFALIASYVSSVSRQVGPKIQIITLDAPLQAYTTVTQTMLGTVTVPQKWAPPGAITDPSEVLGEVSDVPLPSGTDLQRGMLTSPPQVGPGEQEMALDVDPETGVLGPLTPGALVNIIATYQGSDNQHSTAQTVVAGAKVLSVGSISGGSTAQSTVPVTFALTPDQILKVSFADSYATKVRLAIVAPGTKQLSAPPPYLGP